MEDKDFEKIEKLFTRLSDDFGRKLEEQAQVFGRKLEEQGQVFGRKLEEQGQVFGRKLEEQGQVFGKKLEQQSEDFQRWLGVQGDDLQHKLNLVVEGQQLLVERIDRVEAELKAEIRKVDQRVTTVAADLSSHRKDTEAHHGVYLVKEEG